MFLLGFFQEKMPFLEGFPKMASFPCFLCRKIEKDVFQKNPKKIPSPLSTIRALHHSPIYRILDGFTDNATYVQVFKGLIEDGRLSPLLWGIYITVLAHNMFSEEREDQSMNIYHRRVGGRRLRPFSRKPRSCVTGTVEFLESKQT